MGLEGHYEGGCLGDWRGRRPCDVGDGNGWRPVEDGLASGFAGGGGCMRWLVGPQP